MCPHQQRAALQSRFAARDYMKRIHFFYDSDSKKLIDPVRNYKNQVGFLQWQRQIHTTH